MWDYPFFTLCHNSKNHQSIKDLYSDVKTELDNVLDNPLTVNMVTDGYLKPVSNTSQDFSSLVKSKLKNNLSMSVSKLPQVGFANYGDFKPNIYGQADFLDHYFTSICPEWALEHMADGRSTATQINTLKNQYPSLYNDFVNNSLIDLIKNPNDKTPSDRLAMYSYMGLETHPDVSFGSMSKKIQMQESTSGQFYSEQTNTAQSTNRSLKQISQSDAKRVNDYSRPFTSPQGRLP